MPPRGNDCQLSCDGERLKLHNDNCQSNLTKFLYKSHATKKLELNDEAI